MDGLDNQVDDLSLEEQQITAPTQLNLAAIFIRTLEGTESDASTASSLQSLWEVLTDGCSDDERRTRMTSTFEDSSLELLPALAPLLNRPPEVAQLARQLIIDGLGEFASPREVVLAVGEQIEDLLEVERAWAQDGEGYEEANVPSTEDDFDEAQKADPSDTKLSRRSSISSDSEESTASAPEDTEPSLLDAQLPVLIQLLALRVPQTRGRKALATILHLSTLLKPAIARFATHRPPLGLCREVALAVTRLVAAVHAWARGKDDWSPKGEQVSLLLGILSDTITRLAPGLNVKSLERTSLMQSAPATFAASLEGKPLPGLADWHEGMKEVLTAALALFPDAPKGTSDLVPFLSSEKLASFTLLLLSHSPPALLAAETQLVLTIVADEVLTPDTALNAANFIWSLIKKLPPTTIDDPAYRLAVKRLWTVYIPLLAVNPDAQSRQALFSFLSASIAPTLLPPLAALDLLFPFPSPFFDSPLLRPAGLHFLRSIIVHPGSLSWLAGGGLSRLEREVFILPFAEEEAMEVWDVEEDPSGEAWIRGPGPVAVVLALNIYTLLLSRDVNNESGIRRPEVRERWIGPLRRAIDSRPNAGNTVSRPSCDHSHAHHEGHVHAHEEGEDEGNGEESAVAWETVSFALEGVEKALHSLA